MQETNMLTIVKLFGRDVDLDGSWIDTIQLQVDDCEQDANKTATAHPRWQSYLAWFSVLMRQALELRASTIYLRRGRDGGHFSQFLYVPGEESETGARWIELLPMTWTPGAVRAVRALASMLPWSKRGVIRYVYRGERREAKCAVLKPAEIEVYFNQERPELPARL